MFKKKITIWDVLFFPLHSIHKGVVVKASTHVHTNTHTFAYIMYVYSTIRNMYYLHVICLVEMLCWAFRCCWSNGWYVLKLSLRRLYYILFSFPSADTVSHSYRTSFHHSTSRYIICILLIQKYTFIRSLTPTQPPCCPLLIQSSSKWKLSIPIHWCTYRSWK